MSGTSSGATTERDSDWTALSIELPEDSGRTTLAHKLLGSVAPLSYPCPDALVGSARPDAGRASRPGGRYGFKGSVAMPQQVWARHCTVTLGSISVFLASSFPQGGRRSFWFYRSTGLPAEHLDGWFGYRLPRGGRQHSWLSRRSAGLQFLQQWESQQQHACLPARAEPASFCPL